MRQHLVEIGLGEEANGYIRQLLEEGGELSRAVAAQLGRIVRLYTWGPATLDAGSLDRHVRDGGVLVRATVPEPGSKVPVVSLGRDRLLNLIASYLERPGTCLAIDDPWRRPADIHNLGLTAVTYDGNQVVHMLRAGGSLQAADRVIRQVLTWEWCGVLSSPPGLDAASANELSAEMVGLIAATAEHLLLPAFDHEGWILGDLIG